MGTRSWPMSLRAGSLALALLLTGCAGLPEIVAPERAFTGMEPVESKTIEVPAIERQGPPTALTRVPCDEPTPCYTGPVDADEVGAYTASQVDRLRIALQQGQQAVEAGNALSAALQARESEINALIRLGRLTEAQQAIQTRQTEFYRDAYRSEWWTTRIAVALALIGVGLH